ncbi:hypothetical protein J3R30DRAFT_3442463 [Lentinula aciculospora]|uniref:Uncharacterized protein n=1 Tax=Lentinula aciculospora TaxID=153920 RepID=A0A9W9AME7_9AGAR|nr:hypothetical protein J3R30DRAFT_3442463 [Lentinula aciculospora]
MVFLSEIHLSNTLISTSLPSLLVSVFVGLTPEGLHALLATAYYDRTLITAHLTPLLLNAASSPSIARAVSVAGGCDEGIIHADDLAALKISFGAIRGHLSSLNTLTLEALAANAETQTANSDSFHGNKISFIHANPGIVRTPVQDRMMGVFGVFARVLMWVKKIMGEAIGIEESGERHLYLLTTARFTPGGVPIQNGTLTATTTGGSRVEANERNPAPEKIPRRRDG